jgi:hypothetical protein
MKLYSFTEEQLTGVSNDGIDAFLSQLHAIGEIDEDQFNKLTTKYRIMIVRKGVFGRFIDKLFFKNPTDELLYKLVEFK